MIALPMALPAVALAKELSIPAQTLSKSLNALSIQADMNVLFDPALARGQAPAISGISSVDEALFRLLAGTGLTHRFINARTVTIVPVQPSAEAAAESPILRLAKEESAQAAESQQRAAQSPGRTDNTSPGAQTPENKVQEIIVTATKREASIRDVPVSMTALGGEELAEMGAVDFDDYAVKVPGLGFANPGPAGYRGMGPVVNIRGIGGTGLEPTTGYYIDETPLPSQNIKLVDINRIEVLKGPQGTLYGARSYGGLIKVVTNKPRTDAFEANVSLTPSMTDGGEENWEVSGMVNIPLAERFAVRAVGYAVDNSGWIDSVPITNAFGGVNLNGIDKDSNREDTKGGRLSFLWRASEGFDAQLSALYEDQAVDNLMFRDTWLAENYGLNGAQQGLREPTQNTIANYNLTLNFHTSIVDITSSTSFLDLDSFNREDRSAFGNIYMGLATDPSVLNPAIDGLIAAGALPAGTTISTALPILDFFSLGSNDTFIGTRDFTQEVRLLSKTAGPVQWLLGGFYQDRERTTLYTGDIPGIVAAGTLQLDVPGVGATPFPLFSSDKLINRYYTSKIKERGVFGELTYTFAPGWQATAGLRWFDASYGQVLTDLSTSLFVPTVLPPTSFLVSENGLNPKFALAYKPTENAMLFASAAKGFRLGGFTDTAVASPSAGCAAFLQNFGVERGEALPYDSDTLWTYELGAKTAFARGKLAVNGTLFYNNWKDLQQNIVVPACGTGFLQNAGRAVSKGVELEVAAVLPAGLTASAALNYMNSEITESNVFGLPEGTAFTLAPDLKAAFSLTYQRPLRVSAGRWSLFGRADYSYQDGTLFDFNGTHGSIQPAYSTLNLRLGVVSERLDVVAFADNVTDEDAILFDDTFANSFAVPLGTQNRRIRPLRPPTFGLTVTIRY